MVSVPCHKVQEKCENSLLPGKLQAAPCTFNAILLKSILSIFSGKVTDATDATDADELEAVAVNCPAM